MWKGFTHHMHYLYKFLSMKIQNKFQNLCKTEKCSKCTINDTQKNDSVDKTGHEMIRFHHIKIIVTYRSYSQDTINNPGRKVAIINWWIFNSIAISSGFGFFNF